MKVLRAFEAWVVRAEAAVAVSLVLVMLALAGYNVVYRNVLVPLQKHWAHSGPPPAEPAAVAIAKPATPDGPSPAPAGAAEGFGGDWGEGGDDDGPTPAPDAEPGAAEGFAGDWGEGGDDEPVAKPEAKPAATTKPEAAGAAEGFGGDWGEGDGGEVSDDGAPADAKADGGAPKEAAADDEDEAFTKLARIDTARAKDAGETPKGGPPPEGSFAARMVSFIDAIKLAWIDVVLRQLVILVSFFGAMMATQRGKHINVDVFSKLIGPRGQRWLAVVTNLLAASVCAVFARAGAGLVAISREHPHALVSWADEWVFQLMFPFGFGLLAFHFGIQVLGSLAGEVRTEAEVGPTPTATAGKGGAA